MDQPAEASVYENCITLVKNLIKCFKEETVGMVGSMIGSLPALSRRSDRVGAQIFANILEVGLVLPNIYEEGALPMEGICSAISAVYEANKLGYLSRVIRKYHQFLPPPTVKACFEILARIVATPIGGAITP